MELLAPIFAVVGAIAAGVPLMLHMLRRTPSQKLPFSLVQFLPASRPNLTRRSTVEHWPLLLLRILALVLLGLAFARPFQRTARLIAGSDQSGRRIALLVDRSASMRRDGLADAVRTAVREAASQLDSSDQFTVARFSSSMDTVISEESWAQFSAGEKTAAVDQFLQEYRPDWYSTKTGLALTQLAEQLRQTSDGNQQIEIILITDFQQSSDFRALQAVEWADDVDVALRLVQPVQMGNAALHTFRDRSTGESRVRITNAADSATTQYQLQPLDSNRMPVGDPTMIDVPPGRHVSLSVSALSLSDAARSLILGKDAHEFDNRIVLAEQDRRLSRIAHAGTTDANNSDSMRYYLQRAFDGLQTDREPTWQDELEIVDVVTADGLVLPIPEDVQLAILTEAIPDKLLESLDSLLDRSGTIVAALDSDTMAESVAALLPEEVEVREALVDDYAMLGRIDFEHPLFADFSDARFADFSSIRFWKHRVIALPVPDDDVNKAVPWSVVAQFDSGDPAIVRFGRSQGAIYVLAAGWQPDDSQWALSSRFAPMLAGFLNLASPEQAQHLYRTVGDTVRPEELTGSTDWTWQYPDGTTLTSGDADSATVTINAPGRYLLQGQESGQNSSSPSTGNSSFTILAEIDPAESQTAALPAGRLYTLGLAGHDTGDAAKTDFVADTLLRQATAEQLEEKQKFWRWLLLAGLCCLVAEAILAALIHRRQQESL